ncbi:MAG: hypothetical protein H6757_03235 [Candidatus Omnitrophica bacterium]|nr:hypothetical protein [Candidatus Omnitrophota bacterium]
MLRSLYQRIRKKIIVAGWFLRELPLGVRLRIQRRSRFHYPSQNETQAIQTVPIVMVDYDAYPLYRFKKLGSNTIACGLGRLLDHMARYRAGVPFEVLLVINATSPAEKSIYPPLKEKYPFIREVLFHDNTGMDFGAYNVGYQYYLHQNYSGEMAFINSSAGGPCEDGWLLKYHHLFNRNHKTGLCGASMNSHLGSHIEDLPGLTFMPHVQAYFFYSRMEILKNIFEKQLPGAELKNPSKNERVEQSEAVLSRNVLEAGYGISCALFDDFIYFQGSPWKIPYVDYRRRLVFRPFASKI